MEGKLIKSDVQYRLHNEEGIVIATSTDGKLSLKNCQAIENGYDLDELAKDYAINQLANPNEYEHSIYAKTIENTYMRGFQKALEILGDKKFSESDVRKAIDIAWRNEDSNKIDIIESIKKTQWDVEIEWEKDSEGCLILKRL